MTLLYFIGGLAGLILGANLLVRGASRLALSAGISPLVVGLTIVAFGTSSPELAVSVGAVAAGQTDIAIGNVVGSNVLNVLLIGGFFRSLEFTCINALSFAEVEPARMSRATTLSAVWQQLSLSAGVAAGALIVELTLRYKRDAAIGAGSNVSAK